VTDTTAAGRATRPGPDSVLLGRFRLVDRVGDGGGTSLWHAVDQRLRRGVGVRVMPLDHPRVDRLRTAAIDASTVTDRRAVPVLDIADDDENGVLVIVTEWLAATPFGQLLAARDGEPLPPDEASRIALEVARFLAAAEAEGLAHAHVHPNAVMITDGGEVRVRGLGVDRALYGAEPDIAPELADVHGAGAILYAGLTGRWPGPAVVPEIPSVPTLDKGRVPWPSRVRADVPPELDRIAARALTTATPPKGEAAYTSVSEVVAALSAATTAAPAAVAAPRRSGRALLRVGAVVVAVAAAVGMAGLGVDLILGAASPPLTAPRKPSALAPVGPSSTPTPSTQPSTGETTIPIVAAKDVDPFGDTREENPQQAPNAIDKDPSTAWRTVRYKAADLSGKPGVGLMVDLGASRPVSVVELSLVGNGSDIALRASDDPTKPPNKWTSMSEVTGAGDSLVLRVPKPVQTRYLLIWFTQLPWADGAYQGGVSNIRVRG
jgi:hypothetical protein